MAEPVQPTPEEIADWIDRTFCPVCEEQRGSGSCRHVEPAPAVQPTSSEHIDPFMAAVSDFTAWRERHRVQAMHWDDNGMRLALLYGDGSVRLTMSTGDYMEEEDRG